MATYRIGLGIHLLFTCASLGHFVRDARKYSKVHTHNLMIESE